MSIKSLHLRDLLLLLLLVSAVPYAFGQDVAVSGKITDPTGDPLPGVNVLVKGTTRGVVSNMDGMYEITTPAGSTLVFSYIGFLSQEIVVQNAQTLNVTMQTDVANLEEVVVIGYGTVRKSDATGSVATVSSKDFNRGAISSPQDLIVGKTAGVVITSNNGAPGSGSTIRIRGGSSLTASNDPLIVVDGVPVDNTVSGMANPLATINPNDIETFTILKDASATAIYGSRASNGVILITTKKGGRDLTVAYNGTASIYTVPNLVDNFSADEFRDLIRQRYAGNPAAIALLGDANTDWQDEIFRTSFGQDHNLSLSGTALKTPYRVSVGYTDQKGILKTSSDRRTTLLLNLNPTLLDDHLKLNLNVKGLFNKTRFANTGAVGSAVTFDPTKPVMDGGIQHGYFAWTDNGNLIDQAPDNPVALLNLTNDRADVKRSVGNFQIDYALHFLPDLHANLNLGYDYSESDGNKDIAENTTFTSNFKGLAEDYGEKRRMELLDFYLNYTKDITPISSNVNFTAGYSYQHFWRENTDFQTYASDATVLANTLSRTQNYLISFFGRLNYALLDRYLLTFTLRNDGSSKFGGDNKWGLFPSAAFAWKINAEPFLANSSTISDLKLRLGYGETGQQDIGEDFPYLGRYTYSTQDNTAQYMFGNTFYNTLRPEGYDANIKWETTVTYNAGLDFAFVKSRINGSLDVYLRKTRDLLNRIPVAAGTNLTNYITTNVGSMENKGVELTLNSRIISTTNSFWEVSYNIGYNKNEITKLNMIDDPDYYVATGGISGGVGNNIQAQTVGYPINSFFVYSQVYDPDGFPIEGLYVDQNGDGIINSSDLYHYKQPGADVTMGISSRLGYRNFEFSFTGRINLGNYVYNNVASSGATYQNLYNAGQKFISNVNTQVNNSRFVTPQYFSDFYMENGSFFRMDNISLGYEFPHMMDDKLIIRLNAVVQNAFVITKYNGLDPEVNNGIDNNFYPRPRTWLFGLNIEF